MLALKPTRELRGTQFGGWDISCQIPRKSTAVPNRASSEQMMICETAEKARPTLPLAGNRGIRGSRST
jgi:hypothetical protein